MGSLKGASSMRDGHRKTDRRKDRSSDWMTSGEVAREFNMTDAAIRRWAREGLVDAVKTPGGQYRFRREALHKMLESTRTNGVPTAGRRP